MRDCIFFYETNKNYRLKSKAKERKYFARKMCTATFYTCYLIHLKSVTWPFPQMNLSMLGPLLDILPYLLLSLYIYF